MIKRFDRLDRKTKRIIALVLVMLLAGSVLALGLGSTLAEKDPVVENFTKQNTYPEVAVNGTFDRPVFGGRYILSSNNAIATVTDTGGGYTVKGVKAGTMTVSVGSTAGLVASHNYQVTDSNNLTGYSIKNGAEVYFNTASTPVTKPTPVTTAPASAVNDIEWRSLQPGVANVDQNGSITAVPNARGAAIIVGEFIDKWGVERDLHVLVGVGVSLGDDPSGQLNLGDLLEWIAKGEAILGLDDNPYTTDSLGDLLDAVNDGKDVVNLPEPTETDIFQAIEAIKDAIKNLKQKDKPNPEIIGPDGDGNYYLPIGDPPNVYQVVNKDGTSKHNPPKYIYNPRNPADYPDDNRPAIPEGGFFYVEDPDGSNIWKPVDGNGNLDDEHAIWGGGDGKPGGGDDKPVKPFGSDWWVHIGQNVWQKVDKSNPLQLDPTLVGGGGDENPVNTPATPIYKHTDGKYYLGPLGPAGEQYYYGDKKVGGNGKVMSVPGAQHPTDDKYWLVDGEMVDTQPLKAVSVSIAPVAEMSPPGGTVQYTIVITMSDGSKVTDPKAATWEVFPAGRATINETGLLTVSPAAIFNDTMLITARSKVTPDVHGWAILGVSMGTPTVKSVTVSPATANVAKTRTQTFTATVTMSDNKPNTDGVDWSVDSTLSTINANGVLTVHANETKTTLTVTAASKKDGSVKGTATVTITAAPVYITSVVVAPKSASVQQGKTQNFTGTVYKSDSTQNNNVTWSVSGGVSGTSISSGGVLTVSANEPVNKQLTVTATSVEDNSIKDAATVYVTAMGAKSVAVTPTGQSVEKGQQRQFSAVVTMDDNSTNSEVIWKVTTTGGANVVSTISANGLLSVSAGETQGTLRVTATSTRDTSKSGYVDVTIQAMGVKSVQVTPTSATVEKGMTFSFSARAYMNDDSLVNNPAVTWSVNGTNSSINSSGVLTVGKNETFTTLTVTATFGGRQGTASVTVRALGIKSISISPTNPTVGRGKTQAFTVTITMNDNTTVNGPVTWSLAGQTSSGTSLSSSGVLTIGSNQGVGTNVLQVTATASADTSKKATAYVNVTQSTPAGGILEILDRNGNVISDQQWFVLSSNLNNYQFSARYYHPDGRVITSAASPSSFSWYTNALGNEAKFVDNSGVLSIWGKTSASRYVTCTYLPLVDGEHPQHTISIVIN